MFLSCCHVSFHNLKKRLTDSFLMKNGFGVTGKKNKQTKKKKNKDHVIYLKPRFILNSLLCSYKLSNIVFSFRKKKIPRDQGRNTCRKKSWIFCCCLFTCFILSGKSFVEAFEWFLILIIQSKASASILEYFIKQSRQHGPIKISISYCLATSRAKGNYWR